MRIRLGDSALVHQLRGHFACSGFAVEQISEDTINARRGTRGVPRVASPLRRDYGLRRGGR
jgi:hypothetical protein